MEDKIYEAIQGWAGMPTWYTTHALDERRFNEAIANMIETVGVDIQREQFETALMRYATNTPAMLGTPKEWGSVVSGFTEKAMTIIEYEASK